MPTPELLNPATQPTPPWWTQHTPAQPQSPVNGGDFLTAFASALGQHLAAKDTVAGQEQQLQTGATFGRHLGMDGTDTRSPSADPWGAGGLFNGNQTNREATAIRASTQPVTGYQGVVADAKANQQANTPTPAMGAQIAAKYGQPMELDTPYSNMAASTGGVGPTPATLAAQNPFAVPTPTPAQVAATMAAANSGQLARPGDRPIVANAVATGNRAALWQTPKSF